VSVVPDALDYIYEFMYEKNSYEAKVGYVNNMMWQEEVTFRSLTERTEVNKKVSFQTSGQTTLK
jgi:hypothetical protein